MSDQVNVGDYSLEISGDEVLVRDESGAIVETVDLDELDGELTLPDGQKVDLASLLGVEDFETAAGPANDNGGAAGGGAGFTPFDDAADRLGRLGSAGALEQTSLGFDAAPDTRAAANDSLPLQQARASFDWSHREIDSGPAAPLDHPSGPQTSHGNHPQHQDDDEEITPPSVLPIQDSTGPSDNSGSELPDTSERQPDPGNDNGPSAPPTDEQDLPEAQSDEDHEQELPNDEQAEDEPATPPADELDQPESAEQNDGPIASPGDGQNQPEDEPQDPPAEQPQQLTQLNAAPTDIDLSGTTVVENVSGAIIGALTVVDADAGDAHGFAVSDDRFEVVNGHLKLKDGVSLDFEDKASIDITVTATDSGGNQFAEVFSISVGNVNEAPVVTAEGGDFDTKNSTLQPTVDFSDVDSDTLAQAVIHTTGFRAGDDLNVPSSGLFNVTIDQSNADYTVTIVGKTGTETLDQYEDFANSISFSSTSKVEGDRHIQYSVTDSGGASSNVASADIAVTSSQELYTSQLGKGQTTLGGGDDLLHIDTKSISPVRMGDGYDTVHLAQQDRSFGHQDAIKLENVEAIDTTGYGANKVSLSIHDVLNMTDSDHRLTIVGDTGDTVTLTGSGNHQWTVVESNAEFTTYAYSDPSMQAVVEISNQMNAQVS